MLAAVELAFEMGYMDVQIEGDALSIISMMNRHGGDLFPAGLIVQDAKTLLVSFPIISSFLYWQNF